jgi:hypothetical protein
VDFDTGDVVCLRFCYQIIDVYLHIVFIIVP